MKIHKLLLSLVLIVAVIIRFYDINTTPALNPDEAALGYNAYSLILTGKDEHGVSWPLHFKSFGDYKPGGYVYLAIPFIKVLGLTPFAVRLPNLILSILTILFLYKLVLLLTKNYLLSSLTAFVLAVNPWHFLYSRSAFEVTLLISLILAATYYFNLFIENSKNKYLYISIYKNSYLVKIYIILFQIQIGKQRGRYKIAESKLQNATKN